MKRSLCSPVAALVTALGLITLLLTLPHATAVSAQTARPIVQATAAPATEAAPTVLTVVGQVTNGSPGASLPATMTVTLYSVDGRNVVSATTGIADASGKVRFENVAYQPGRSFALVTVLGTVPYKSELLAPRAGEKLLTLPLRIFGTTTDRSRIRIDQMYIVGQFVSDKELQVVQGYAISNAGDRTVEGGEVTPDGRPATLRFPLPPGASKVEYQNNDGTYVPVENGYLTTWGIPPGRQTAQVAVRYTLPYSGLLHFETSAAYPVDNVNLAMADQGITLTSTLLKESGTQSDPNGVTYRVYTATTLAAGQVFAADLNGTPKIEAVQPSAHEQSVDAAAPPANSILPARWDKRTMLGAATAGAGLLVVVVSLVWYLVARRRGDAELTGEAIALSRAIADLDEDHEAGKIGDEEYAQQRNSLTAALLAALEAPLAPAPYWPSHASE